MQLRMHVLRHLRGNGFESECMSELWRWVCAAAGAAFQRLEKRQFFGERPRQPHFEAPTGGFGGLCEVGGGYQWFAA
jgi:hypothetical protein